MELLQIFGQPQVSKTLFDDLLTVKNIRHLSIDYYKTESMLNPGKFFITFEGNIRFVKDNSTFEQNFEGSSIFDVLQQLYDFLSKL